VGAGAGEGAEVYVVMESPPNFWELDRGLVCFVGLSRRREELSGLGLWK
jgi:hypothetical protein